MAHLELWWAPSKSALANTFRHSLVGTATASLYGAEDGTQLSCGVHACGSTTVCNTKVRVAFSLAKGACANNSVPLDLPTTILASPEEATDHEDAGHQPDGNQHSSADAMEEESDEWDGNLHPLPKNVTWTGTEDDALSDCRTGVNVSWETAMPARIHLTVVELVLPLTEKAAARAGHCYSVRAHLPGGGTCDLEPIVVPTTNNGGSASERGDLRSDRLPVGLECTFEIDMPSACSLDHQVRLLDSMSWRKVVSHCFLSITVHRCYCNLQ